MFKSHKMVIKTFLSGLISLFLVSCGDDNIGTFAVKVESHPFSIHEKIDSLSALPKHIESVISENGLHQNLGFSLSEAGLSEDRSKIEFNVEGVPVCRSSVIAHSLKSSDQPFVLGEVPAIREIDGSSDFPQLNDALSSARSSIDGNSHYFDLASSKRCIFVNDQDIGIRSLEMILSDRTKEYLFFVSAHGVLHMENRHFHVETAFSNEASVQAYKLNPYDESLAIYEFSSFDDSGFLANKYFKSINETTNPATSSNGQFIYDPSDTEFTEANVFVHANLSLQHAIQHGFVAPASQISLYPHAVMSSGDKNNAAYLPSNSAILIGDGDGYILQNLGLDGDVVSHEVGHHVVFQTLTSTSGQSLVLHEGLADFLTFSRTNDSCLGESICPENTTKNICVMKGQCLRNAKNNIVYLSSNWPTEVHLKGQIVSGLLWDLTEKHNIERSVVTKTIIKALSYLTYNSGYRDLIVSLMVSDKEINNSQHSCTIWSLAIERGFEDELEGLSCEGESSSVDNIRGVVSTNSSTETTTRTERSSNSGSTFCAVTPNAKTGNHVLSLILLTLMPLILVAMERRHARTRK